MGMSLALMAEGAAGAIGGAGEALARQEAQRQQLAMEQQRQQLTMEREQRAFDADQEDRRHKRQMDIEGLALEREKLAAGSAKRAPEVDQELEDIKYVNTRFDWQPGNTPGQTNIIDRRTGEIATPAEVRAAVEARNAKRLPPPAAPGAPPPVAAPADIQTMGAGGPLGQVDDIQALAQQVQEDPALIDTLTQEQAAEVVSFVQQQRQVPEMLQPQPQPQQPQQADVSGILRQQKDAFAEFLKTNDMGKRIEAINRSLASGRITQAAADKALAAQAAAMRKYRPEDMRKYYDFSR